MKVWIVNPFDNLPTEGFRPQRFWLMAEAFAAAGHEVTLVTSSWSHSKKSPRTCLGSGHSCPRLSEAQNFTIHYIPTLPYYKNISIRRFWSHFILAKRFSKFLRSTFNLNFQPDLIIVSSPTLGLVRAVRKSGVKYIVDVMDAWPETFERVLPRWMLWPLRVIAKKNYLGAAAISVVAKRYEELVRSYGYKGKVKEFYHGIK